LTARLAIFGDEGMKRLWLVLLTALPFVTSAHAQSDPRAPKTGRTEDGLKIDAEIDKEYRAKAGQPTPKVTADPWGGVRTVPTQVESKTIKAKTTTAKKP
jgi:hypothetical protein